MPAQQCGRRAALRLPTEPGTPVVGVGRGAVVGSINTTQSAVVHLPSRQRQGLRPLVSHSVESVQNSTSCHPTRVTVSTAHVTETCVNAVRQHTRL